MSIPAAPGDLPIAIATEPATPAEVWAWWFGPPSEAWSDAEITKRRMHVWFGGGPAVDAELSARFGATVRAALAGELESWLDHHVGRMALLLALDQFTRNLYRGTAEAFAGDPRARAVLARARAEGDLHSARPVERFFLALPLEHHEDRASQAEAVAMTRALADEMAHTEAKATFENIYDYAVRHQVVVERFGRFPHRNAVLGRESTAEEIAFLQTPGSSF